MRISILFILFFVVQTIAAQDEYFQNPYDAAMGTSGVLSRNDWAVFSNPAGTADADAISAGVGYNNSYLVSELDSKAVFVLFPTKLLNTAVSFTYFGYGEFNVQRYNILASKQIAPWFNAGLRFNYTQQNQIGADHYHILTVDAGLQIKPIEKISIGLYAVNPAATKWNLADYDEYKHSFVAAGINYDLIDGLNVELSVLKDTKFSPIYSFLVDYRIIKNLRLRGAVSGEPITIGYGAELTLKNFIVNAGFNHHSQLGFSSSVGLIYSIKN